MKRLFWLATCLFCNICAYAQATDSTHIKANRQRSFQVDVLRTATPVRVDGKLDEPIWQVKREAADRFFLQFPFDTSYAKAQTSVLLAYDDKYLYVAATCYDPVPGNYVVQDLRRDFAGGTSDLFGVVLNPFNDKTNGFNFSVSPYGVQREALMSNADQLGLEWDNKWYSEVLRQEGVWYVEMAIPFRSLRYADSTQLWHVNFIRSDGKANERSTWHPVPRGYATISMIFTGTLRFQDKLQKPKGLSWALIPYASGSYNKNYADGTEPLGKLGLGTDFKLAVTPSLNLDLTINPDFSQADVDRQQINLTRFNLFFPERRQFFIENSDLFSQFGFGGSRPFFSRRIGLDATASQATPILFGARLSGKLGQGWRLGAMTVQTEGLRATETPSQNYSVLAVQRQVFTNSNIGAIVVNRQAFGGSGIIDSNFNRVVGADFNLYSKNGKWNGDVFVQRSFDRTNSDNAYAHGQFVQFNVPRFRFFVLNEHIQRDFNAEVGFAPRVENYDPSTERVFRMTSNLNMLRAIFYTYPKQMRLLGKGVNNYGIGTFNQVAFDSTWHSYERRHELWTEVNFQNTSGMGLLFAFSENRLLWPLRLSSEKSDSLMPVGNYRYQNIEAWYFSDNRKPLNFEGNFQYGGFYNGNFHRYFARITYRFQPWGSITLRVEHNDIFLPTPYGNPKLTLAGPETLLSFSKSLFFTTISQYNTQAQNLNLFIRLQYRFAPMSDLFVVYSDNYNQQFGIKNRSFIIKLVYWLSPS